MTEEQESQELQLYCHECGAKIEGIGFAFPIIEPEKVTMAYTCEKCHRKTFQAG